MVRIPSLVGAALALALTACARVPDAAAEPVVRPVVSRAVAELEARLGPMTPAPPADEETVRRVRELLASIAADSSPLRSARAARVSEYGDAAVPVLVAVLFDLAARSEARIAAAELLATLDSERAAFALTSLVETHPESWVRAQCAFRLGSTHHDRVVPALLARLARERDDETRIWIAWALARFHDYAGVDVLLRLAAGAPEARIRTSASERLTGLAQEAGVDDGRELWRRFAFADPEGRLAGPPPSDRLELEVWKRIESLAAEDAEHAHADAIDVLAKLPGWAAGMLAEALSDRSGNLRLHAARALEAMGPRAVSAGPTLVSALRWDRANAAAIAAALGGVRYVTAARELERHLDAAHPLDLRVAAAQALGRLDSPACAPSLERVLDPREPSALRAAAALSLLALGGARTAVPVLAELALADGPGFDRGAFENGVGNWLETLERAGDPRAKALREAWLRLESEPAVSAAPAGPDELAARRVRARAELLQRKGAESWR